MQGLAHLFKAPSALMFQGTFDEAKAKAVEEGKWLVCALTLQLVVVHFLYKFAFQPLEPSK